MFTVTIQAENAQQLAAIAKHLEVLEAPAFVRSEVSKPVMPLGSAVAATAPVDASKVAKVEKPKVAKVEKPKDEKAANGLDYEDVKNATYLVAGIPGKGANLTTEILSGFGVDHAKKLPEAQWAEYIKKCEEVAGKHKEPANFA